MNLEQNGAVAIQHFALANGRFIKMTRIFPNIPEDLRDSHMNTAGVYSEWHFVDWIEEFSDYEDGMGCHDWIAANKGWLDQFCDTEIDFENVYWAFNASDFRPGSCGGCI